MMMAESPALGIQKKAGGQTVECDDDDDGGQDAGSGGTDARLGLECRARERARGGVCAEYGTDGVGHTDGDQLLVGVDLVPVDPSERYAVSETVSTPHMAGIRDRVEQNSHLEMAMCSKSRMIVATGSSDARADTSLLSMTGGPTCWKPRGTVCKILIGYLPDLDLRWRQKSQDAIVRTMMTKALRKVEMKKNKRSEGGLLVLALVEQTSQVLTSSREPSSQEVADHADGIQAEKAGDTEGGIELGLRQEFQRVDDDLVRRSASTAGLVRYSSRDLEGDTTLTRSRSRRASLLPGLRRY